MTTFPNGTTHLWSHWNMHFKKWCPYVGLVDKNFLNARMPLVGEA